MRSASPRSFIVILLPAKICLPAEPSPSAASSWSAPALPLCSAAHRWPKRSPEYATATLYVAGLERPLADFALDKQPLRSAPVHMVEGPVPQLRLDELIGRRRELRETLRTLRDAR